MTGFVHIARDPRTHQWVVRHEGRVLFRENSRKIAQNKGAQFARIHGLDEKVIEELCACDLKEHPPCQC